MPDLPIPSSDPLNRLGDSIFLDVIVQLDARSVLQVEQVCKSWQELVRSHEKGIWRSMCHRSGVKEQDMEQLEEQERASGLANAAGYKASLPTSSAEDHEVDWRKVCKGHIMLDINWRWGHCHERFATAGLHNNLWRFKVDNEQDVVISTDISGGLSVTDIQTSESLYRIPDVVGTAHVEFAKGLVVFNDKADNGESLNHDFVFEVFRTPAAISRSSKPTPLPGSRSRLVATAHDPRDPSYHAASHIGDIPRGYLAPFRTIVPPEPCFASRARLDYEGEGDKERAIFCAVGYHRIYIWDLDDDQVSYDIPITHIDPEHDLERRTYVEFDEDHVFVCGLSQMHVYSRHTRTKLLSFPPDPATVQSAASVAFQCSSSDSTRPPDRSVPGLPMSPIGKVYLDGVKRGDENWQNGVMSRIEAERGDPYPIAGELLVEFSTCHVAGSDLICTSRVALGSVFIVRNYRHVLAAQTLKERQERVVENTIWLMVHGAAVQHLATCGTRVVFATHAHVFFFDRSSLPAMPVTPDSPPPTIRLHVLLSNQRMCVGHSSCLQIDERSIWMVYPAAQQGTYGYLPPTASPIPDAMLTGYGFCLKVWNFEEYVPPVLQTLGEDPKAWTDVAVVKAAGEDETAPP